MDDVHKQFNVDWFVILLTLRLDQNIRCESVPVCLVEVFCNWSIQLYLYLQKPHI